MPATLRPAAVAVEVGVGDVAVAAEAALFVGAVAATVLLGQVAPHLLLYVGVRRFVAAVAGELRRLETALIGEAAAVLVVTLGTFPFELLGELLVLLSHVR